MKVALVNPPWSFERSIYFGCRAPHLPLELGYAKALLEAHGHSVLMLDGHLFGMTFDELALRIAEFAPAMTVVATAPSYLFWRCAQPEMRVPRRVLDFLGKSAGFRVAIGPHGSATPAAALRKLGADAVIRGECEEAILELAEAGFDAEIPGVVHAGEAHISGAPRACKFVDSPPLRWGDDWIARHTHHHHRFDRDPVGPGAEVEASRGCPYACTFCAKLDFRDRYRRRRREFLVAEIDGLIAQGVTYLYFIDEIFLPDRELLDALTVRPVEFGVQTRIDLWKPELLDRLGGAGCVSIEAGVESLTELGRSALDKKCRMSTEQLTALLLRARASVPFVQANLIATPTDDPAEIEQWRSSLRDHGVWANDPVPLYPYPSSPDYRRLFGEPDEMAWERAHAHYLAQFESFSDIQSDRPLPLDEVEVSCRC